MILVTDRLREQYVTLEPDGKATGCNPVQVGSIPTGVSEESDCRLRLHPLKR